MSTPHSTTRTEIAYDRETHDYAMYFDGELVGFARTYYEAETTLDALMLELAARVEASSRARALWRARQEQMRRTAVRAGCNVGCYGEVASC